MTEIAFHFNVPDKLVYACRLLRKALASDVRVVVTGASVSLQALDSLLWTFSPLEFIAHCRAGSPAEQVMFSPVVLVSDVESGIELPHYQVLLNLGTGVAAGYERFERAIEIVTLEEADRQLARERWKYYADRGYSISRHDLKLKETSI